MATSALVLASEAALALYPILIKTVPTNLGTQVLSRLLVYSGLAYAFSSDVDVQTTWGTPVGILRSMGLGALTLLHIGSSYFAFQQLPAGISMSLFYTYPIWNLVGAALFLGEAFSLQSLLLVGLGFIGAVLLALSSKDPDPSKDPWNWKGLGAALLAALTESAIYFAVRTAERPSPFFAVLELYPAALLYLIPVLLYMNTSLDFRPGVWTRLLSFNTLIGFLGYCLRFYAIPRLPTLVFSLLSFVGVLASFSWGYFFLSEKPTFEALLGGLLIGSAAGFSSVK